MAQDQTHEEKLLELDNVSEEDLNSTETFEDWSLSPKVLQALGAMGYEKPTRVQRAVYHPLEQGRDIMVQSHTGSGKTAAFGIPLVNSVDEEKKCAQALILAPTRELAIQVGRELEKIAEFKDLTVIPVYGGAPIKKQIDALEAGAQIIAGTPGRVMDHIKRGTLNTDNIAVFVLDECDEMLSMGFQEDIEDIIRLLPEKEKRQTLLFSATIPGAIERIGRRYMREPEMIQLSSDSVGVDLIDHFYYVVSGIARTRDLWNILRTIKPDSAIIFCNTRDDTNTVAKYLTRKGYEAAALSSDLSQSERERVLARKRDGKLRFLVATDIAARGIDISDISHVINYTFPDSAEVYVHRTGRTGRAGKDGIAISLIGPTDIGSFYNLKLMYKIIPEERALPSKEEIAIISAKEGINSLLTELNKDSAAEYATIAEAIAAHPESARLIASLVERYQNPPKPKAAPSPTRSARSSSQGDAERTPKSPRASSRDSGRNSSRDSQRSEASAEEGDENGRRRRRSRRPRRDRPAAEEAQEALSLKNEDVATRITAPAEVKEASSQAESDEKAPRTRKRRRRRRSRNDDQDSLETSVALKPDDSAAETSISMKGGGESSSRKKGSGRKPSSPKSTARVAPKTTAGGAVEFWEAWADEKTPPPPEADAKTPVPGDEKKDARTPAPDVAASEAKENEAKPGESTDSGTEKAKRPPRRRSRSRKSAKSSETPS